MTLAAISARLTVEGLTVLGSFRPLPDDGFPPDIAAVLLIGPDGAGFWPHLATQPEWRDGRPDPIDRWSRRVIGRLACDLGGKAVFPFDGPPWRPFQSWAQRTGRIWQSPVGLLVHAEAGLWVSFRGALALRGDIDLPPPLPRPCDSCADRPCLTACPAGALGAGGYDVPACHAWLDLPEGAGCMTFGCAVRRACPVSAGHGRMPEQSAYHMRQFHR
ncbi:MAG: ferredoxin [Gemmobacter sp.]